MRLPLVLRLALAAVLAAAVLLPGAARAATAPNPFAGMVSEDAFAGSDAYRAAVLHRLAGMGVGTMRQTLDWAVVEPQKGQFDWSMWDRWVGATAKAGMQVLPVVFNTPAWASSRPATGAKRGTYPPRRFADFGAFAAAAARRYGPGGTFWLAHPGIPAKPITAWQIWNEPSLPVYWQPRPSARGYVALLQAAATAIRAVQPDAEIVTAGLPKSKLGIPLTTYVRQLYAAGGAPWFDAIALNPYARSAGGVVAFVRQVRAVMDRAGDPDTRIWATEIGWSDRGPGGKFKLGRSGQAKAIRTVLPRLWAARQALRLQGVVYFNWRDAKPYPGGHDFWGLHTGLLKIGGAPKLALRSFRNALATLR